jgi:hypothetical protein
VDRVLYWRRSVGLGHVTRVIAFAIVKCPFHFAPEDVCDQFEAFTDGIIESIDPRYELVHLEAKCRGDGCCIRTI